MKFLEPAVKASMSYVMSTVGVLTAPLGLWPEEGLTRAKLPEVAQMAARLRARNHVTSTFHPSCIICQNYGQPR